MRVRVCALQRQQENDLVPSLGSSSFSTPGIRTCPCLAAAACVHLSFEDAHADSLPPLPSGRHVPGTPTGRTAKSGYARQGVPASPCQQLVFPPSPHPLLFGSLPKILLLLFLILISSRFSPRQRLESLSLSADRLLESIDPATPREPTHWSPAPPPSADADDSLGPVLARQLSHESLCDALLPLSAATQGPTRATPNANFLAAYLPTYIHRPLSTPFDTYPPSLVALPAVSPPLPPRRRRATRQHDKV
ncbi:hypothetical protein XA68_11533 [Ophiocordyceps unilateralis]|uniref:Uncharacterized protein n=1 Tax=Ophiocordyceps unilateralis TaxID=268505 RepID=A0A2A9PF79_OPHUN|nr:hypothetical protein XA68_11533 [Ophiocordyceps unilateralis]